MKKLDLYLLRKFAGPFVAVFLVVDFALSLQFIWALLNELMGKGLGMLVILEFLGWGACTLFTYAIPLATLLASIMTLGDLGERNELLAIKAAGVSLARALAPLMAASVIISVGAFYAADRLVPYAFQQIYQLRADIARTRDEIIARAKQEAADETAKMISHARTQIEAERVSAAAELRREVAVLSVEVAEKVLRSRLSSTPEQKTLIDKLVDEAAKAPKADS